MNKPGLIDAVAQRMSSTKSDASSAVDAVLAAIGDGLAADGDVKIVGFGAFTKKRRESRTGRNPATGEAITIAAKTSVKFKAGKDLEARV